MRGQKRIVEGHLFHKIIPLIENPWVQCSHKIAVWVRLRVNNQPCGQDYPLPIIFKRAFAQKKKSFNINPANERLTVPLV